MDLRAVKAATAPELAAAATAAIRNAESLLRDAEVLAEAQSPGSAYSLAALAVEEVGKAASLSALAIMPEALRARAPVRRMLEWHQLKQAMGQLIAEMPYGPPGLGSRLVAMPAGDLEQMLNAFQVRTEEADRLKRGGLYVDISQGGLIRGPSEITRTALGRQIARARRATGSARMLLYPDEQEHLLNPCVEAVECTRAAFSALAEAGYARTPDAAADLIIKMVGKLRQRMTGIPLHAA